MLFILFEMLLMLAYRRHKPGNRTHRVCERERERERERKCVTEKESKVSCQ